MRAAADEIRLVDLQRTPSYRLPVDRNRTLLAAEDALSYFLATTVDVDAALVGALTFARKRLSLAHSEAMARMPISAASEQGKAMVALGKGADDLDAVIEEYRAGVL